MKQLLAALTAGLLALGAQAQAPAAPAQPSTPAVSAAAPHAKVAKSHKARKAGHKKVAKKRVRKAAQQSA
ncbi:hypothetical protein C6568_01615 [Melaminivora suipulveris]|uniref:Acid-shock protein n=1 Tax=Melaminivora suipulveris TaxID=2109913 RepID=A0A2R3Q8U0_9BURK|nr:hypothetical protein [Melaminivora suipulveris]AVO48094.1 hypothetical protein C6568_01615 [Melaminivora suipulveris]